MFEISAEDKLRFKTVKVIKRFSHFKNESVIKADVSSITFNSEFANGKPTSYHEVVADRNKKVGRPKDREVIMVWINNA